MKRTIVSKFPRTVTTVSDARAQLQAMTCASESISSMTEKELLSDEVEADIFFVIVPAIALIYRNVTVESELETAETFIYNCRATKSGVVINAIALDFQSKLKFIIVDWDYTILILFTICLLCNVTTRWHSSKLALDKYVPPDRGLFLGSPCILK